MDQVMREADEHNRIMIVHDDSLIQTLSRFDRETLLNMAETLPCEGLEDLTNLDDVIACIRKTLLTSDVMYHRLGLLSDRDMAVFNQIADGAIELEFTNDNLFATGRIDEIGYIVLTLRDLVYVADDVIEAYRHLRREDFPVFRKHAAWYHACLTFARHVYGVMTTSQMLDLYNNREDVNIVWDDLHILDRYLPDDFRCYEIKDETYYFRQYKDYLMMANAVSRKPICLPSATEVTDVYNYGYPYNEACWRKLRNHLIHSYGMVPYDADVFLAMVWKDEVGPDNDRDVFHHYADNMITDENDRRVLTDLWRDMHMHTRQFVLHGQKPIELFVQHDENVKKIKM